MRAYKFEGSGSYLTKLHHGMWLEAGVIS